LITSASYQRYIIREQIIYKHILLLISDMDFIVPERRTTRKDLKRKREYNKYKKGGSFRIKERNDRNRNK